MNKKVNVDKDAIKLLFSRYKNYLVPLATILLCVALFIYVIIPQVQNIQALQIQEKEEARKLEILKNNLNLLYSLDSTTLDNQLKLVAKALPVDKDFIGILSGVAIASSKSKATLGDYGFQVGDISKAPTSAKGIPGLELTLTVNGGLNTIIDFIKELKRTLPLSEIKSINLASNSTTLTTFFYFKPLPPVKIKDDSPLSPLSSSVLEVINNLSSMNNSSVVSIEDVSEFQKSSPSAVFSGT
jgi:hypothetical protein